MALYVTTNVSSLNSQRRLSSATKSLDTTYQRLSSGLRINSARDDAAGLQISNRLTNQINGLKQGNRNANDGIALCQTMEGALDETTNMLQRIRTLAIQAANGTNTQIDRDSIQQEITQLSSEITRIACKTFFAGRQCLAGVDGAHKGGVLDQSGKVTFQVGAYAFDTLSVSMSAGFTLSGIYSLYVKTNGGQAITITDKSAICSNGLFVNAAGFYEFNCYTQDNAEYTIQSIDNLINIVDSKRAELGAIQNRMESTIRNQENVAENVSDARSRIRDADYAEESANLTAQNILQQASTTVLTQANQRPSIAMSLLSGG
ncbi:flagellin [Succinivibrio dextrinosolvens]|jgi:flagellin|uniref:flagellin N-terminal helical domain-containing protein n=1 Tax=Succinivibrio dextrinosolvens TaxID=83771 RepID=UPI00241E2487|nr:flagellin [Succinivibrio dextrinosolvens]MBE6424024.1 flagellin [Succinivibrio dextrinosolvens]